MFTKDQIIKLAKYALEQSPEKKTQIVEALKKSKLKKLTPITEQKVSSIKSSHSGIPKQYLDFLSVVGHGRTGSFTFYSGPSSAEDFYGKDSSKHEKLVYFGDDNGDAHYAFDPSKKWAVVYTESAEGEAEKVSTTFLKFLKKELGFDLKSF